MDDLIMRAARFAEVAHRGVARKGEHAEAYINHPARVAGQTAVLHGATPAMVAAAFLHDTVEDTPVTVEQIGAEFGLEVAVLVDHLTDQYASGPGKFNRKTRKRLEAERLGRAPADAQAIKALDVIDNLRTTPLEEDSDYQFAMVFLREKLYLLDQMTKLDGLLRERVLKAGFDLAGEVWGVEGSPVNGARDLLDEIAERLIPFREEKQRAGSA